MHKREAAPVSVRIRVENLWVLRLRSFDTASDRQSRPNLRTALSALIARCKVTRYTDGKPVELMLCRISGYVPPAAPRPKKK